MEHEIARVVERYRYMDECMVIARGLNQATCQEAALKLAETCYVVAKPYSAADFQHGPIATIDQGFPVFLYAPPGKAYEPMVEIADKLLDKGAELIVVSTEDDILAKAQTPIKIPVGVDEIYSPLLYIVVGQLFAEYLSIAKGNNPDHPRGLSKVTLTM
jgi:glucosamine--fructose-6-phosphate aminotransferase (isomerizing)